MNSSFIARIRALLAVVPLLASCPLAAQVPADLEGSQWESVDRSLGGLGMVYTFMQRGEVAESFGPVIDFTYRVAGDRIVMTLDGIDAEFSYSIREDQLTMTSATGEKVTYRWRGPRAELNSVKGLWAFRHETGAPGYLFFGSTGHGLLRVLLKERRGSYWIAPDGLLHLQMNGGTDRSMTGNLLGDQLQLHSDQRTFSFRQVQY